MVFFLLQENLCNYWIIETNNQIFKHTKVSNQKSIWTQMFLLKIQMIWCATHQLYSSILLRSTSDSFMSIFISNLQKSVSLGEMSVGLITKIEPECWETIAVHTTFSCVLYSTQQLACSQDRHVFAETVTYNTIKRQRTTQRELWRRYLKNIFKEKTDVMIWSMMRNNTQLNKDECFDEGEFCKSMQTSYVQYMYIYIHKYKNIYKNNQL